MTTMSSKYASEEVLSSCVYPSGYKGAKSLPEQAALLKQLFPELQSATFDIRIARNPLPQGAEDWFVVPPWQLLVANLPEGRRTYGQAVEILFAKIASQRPFHNHRPGQLGASFLRQLPRTEVMFEELWKKQSFRNFVVVPAQFGFHHRSRSVRRARELFTADELGLGVFAVGIMLLTHPERIDELDQLQAVCAGDEFVLTDDRDFIGVPLFNFCNGKLNFVISWSFDVNPLSASVSAFRPQPPVSTPLQKA